MATFEPISYAYVPTPPRSKSTTARRKLPLKLISTLDKNKRIKPSSVVLEEPQQFAVAVVIEDIGDEQPRVQDNPAETGIINSDNDKENNDNNYFPTVEEILYTALHKEGFATKDSKPDHAAQEINEAALEETSSSVDSSRLTPDNGLGTSRSDPIIIGEDESDDSEAEVDYFNHRGESAEPDTALFGSTETALDSRILLHPSHLEGCHDIKHHSSTKTTQCLQLAKEGAVTSDSIYPNNPSSPPSSDPLHDYSRTDELYRGRARSKATISHFGCSQNQSPRCSRTLPQYKPSQEDHLPASQSTLNEDELLGPTLGIGTDTFAKENKQQQQEEEEEEEDNDDNENNEDKEQYSDKDNGQREVNNVAVAQTAGRGDDTNLSSEDESALPDKQRRPLPSHHLFLQPGQEGTGSHSDSCSDGEISNTCAKSDKEQRRLHSTKQKLPSSSDEGTRQKKRRYYLQHQSTRQPKPRSRSQQPCAENVLPSPAPSTPQALDTELPSDHYTVGGSSRDIQPMLTEITFRPHSLHECSFTAVIQANHGRPEFSFSQVAKLIESISYVRKINDFTIKPLTQNSFLLVSFSRTLGTATNTSCIHKDKIGIQLQHSNAVDARATALCKGELSCGQDNDVLNNSDPNLSSSSDNDVSSVEDEQWHSSTRKRSMWLPLDKQRLLAYKKEGKSWSWIFRKFPGRTHGAVHTRWHIAQAQLPE